MISIYSSLVTYSGGDWEEYLNKIVFIVKMFYIHNFIK